MSANTVNTTIAVDQVSVSPQRPIDQDTSKRIFIKHVIVLGNVGSGTEAVGVVLKQLGLAVYDAAEAASNFNRDLPLWIEAVEAKKAGKPYTRQDFDKLIGPYHAIVGDPATYFVDDLLKAYSNIKAILVTDNPVVSVTKRHWFDRLSPLLTWLGPALFGRFHLFLRTTNKCLIDFHAVRAQVASQNLLEFNRLTPVGELCQFLGQPPLQGHFSTVKGDIAISIVKSRLNDIATCFANRVLHSFCVYTIVSWLVVAFMINESVYPLNNAITFTGILLCFLVNYTSIRINEESKRLAFRAVIADAYLADASGTDGSAVDVANVPKSAYVPPHLRKNHPPAASQAQVTGPAVPHMAHAKFEEPRMDAKPTCSCLSRSLSDLTPCPHQLCNSRYSQKCCSSVGQPMDRTRSTSPYSGTAQKLRNRQAVFPSTRTRSSSSTIGTSCSAAGLVAWNSIPAKAKSRTPTFKAYHTVNDCSQNRQSLNQIRKLRRAQTQKDHNRQHEHCQKHSQYARSNNFDRCAPFPSNHKPLSRAQELDAQSIPFSITATASPFRPACARRASANASNVEIIVPTVHNGSSTGRTITPYGRRNESSIAKCDSIIMADPHALKTRIASTACSTSSERVGTSSNILFPAVSSTSIGNSSAGSHPARRQRPARVAITGAWGSNVFVQIQSRDRAIRSEIASHTEEIKDVKASFSTTYSSKKV